MELAGFSSLHANATSSCLSFIQNFSLENSASNQKTFRIVKEQTPRGATPHHGMSLRQGHPVMRREVCGIARISAEVVEQTGIEPVTFWLQTRRSPS